MAQEPPATIDMNELQFPMRNKSQLFVGDTGERVPYSLLAAASLYGLVVAGSNKPELRVFQLSSVVDKAGDSIPIRTIPLTQAPRMLALSCDHSMLAVNYDQNGSSFISVYSVPSLVSNNVSLLYQHIVLSPDANVSASELLWNPVMPNTLAVTLNNGSLAMFNFNGQGYELHTIDKAEQVRCASWSPKGKQIVLGFPAGKLAQYKPDLKLARTIPCPENIFGSAFDVITVQWLSTYQFAAVFLKRETGECPAVFIVNAPKNVSPTYVNYDDICYSQSGPRPAQVFLAHILPWNIILVASANSMEVGVLGTRETGETPNWSQYFIDGMRPEIPLTADKQEIYPIGLAVDTGCSHRLTMNEVQLEVMPMMHLLATNGLLVSFDVVNKMAGIPTLCQAPKALADTSGMHHFVNTPSAAPPPASVASEISFSVPPTVATSTPAVAQKTKPSIFTGEIKPSGTSLFGSSDAPKPSFGFTAGGTGSIFGGQTTIQSVPAASKVASADPQPAKTSDQVTKPSFGVSASTTAFGGASMFGGSKPAFGNVTATSTAFSAAPQGFNGTFSSATAAPVKPTAVAPPTKPVVANENKPFLTVGSNYTPQSSGSSNNLSTAPSKATSFGSDDNKIIRKMIAEEITSFEYEWNAVLTRSRKLDITIGTKDEMAAAGKQLNELQDISGQATESTDALSLEIQSLRMLLNETFAMVTEAKAKRAMFSNVDVNTLRDTSTMSQTSRRQMEKLQRLLATNETQYQIVSKQIDAFWSTHQQNVKQNKKALMHIPQLENVYMTMTKQRQILKGNAQKLAYIKSKIGYRDPGALSATKIASKHDMSVNSLSDSIFSMSLCDQVKLETEKLSPGKMSALRDFLKTRQTITQITPKRPDRKGLSSEVVLERKIALEKTKSTPKPVQTKPEPVVHAPAPTRSQPAVSDPVVPKLPTVQPVVSKAPQPVQPIKQVVSAATPAPSFGFGGNAAGAKPFGVSMAPTFGSSPAPTFGSSTTPTFGSSPAPTIQQQPKTIDPAPKPTLSTGFSGFNATAATSTPIAFGGFKAPDASSGGPSISFGSSGKPLATTTPASVQTTQPNTTASTTKPSATSSTPFSGFSTGGAISFGSSTPAGTATPAFGSSPAASSAATSAPAFSFSIASSPAFGTSTPKPLTPTLNALLPKGIAAAAAADAVKPATTATTSSAVVKPTVADKENRPVAAAAPLALTKKPLESAPSKPADLSTTPSNGIGGGLSTVFGSATPFGGSAPAFGSVTAAPAKPTTTSAAPSIFGNLQKATSTDTTPTPSAPATTTTPSAQGFTFSLSGGATTVTSAPVVPATKPVAADTSSEQTVPAVDGTDNLFQGLTVCKPDAATSNAAPTSGSNIFSMPAFGAAKPADNTNSSPSTASIFGGAAPATSTAFGASSTNVFGAKPEPTATAASTTTTSASPFATFAAQNPGPPPAGTSIFGGAAASLPKPEQSVFGGAASTNAFGAPAAAATNVFGGSGTTAPSAFGASASTNAFGSPAPAASAASTSIFGQSSFGQQPTNVFGQSPSAAAAPAAGASIFGGSSVFGGAAVGAAPAASTTSIFGGGSSALAPSAFGSSTFGSSAAAPSAFGQGSSIFGGAASSPAQTAGSGGSMFGGGFGSPSAAAPAAAGGFGAPPAFGASPSFGGAATFGSPKGNAFGGSFGQTAASPPSFATQVTQKNSLFESLGSSETGMTFGNIAQNTSTNAPAAFGGGSSFSSWR